MVATKLCLLLAALITTVNAQTGNSFLPSAGLQFARTTAQAESGDTGVVLVSIAWTKHRTDGITPGNFDTSTTGAMPVWDYTFLSPTQSLLYEYTISLTGSQYQILQRRQRIQDTARPIDRTWYDIDSVLPLIVRYNVNNRVEKLKTQCPDLEVAIVRLCMVRERYIYRTYIPMWIVEHWCIPQRLKHQAFVDAWNRAIILYNDSLELVLSIPYEKPGIPSKEQLVLTGSSVPLSPPLLTESTVRIFDILGRVVSEQFLPAGSTSLPIPLDLPRGTYSIVCVDTTGRILRWLHIVRIE